MANEAATAQKTEQKSARLNFEETKSLEDWIALLNDKDNPPLGEQVALLLKSMPSDPGDLPAIMQLVESNELREKVLRHINDAYFNPAEPSIDSIARAIIVLGFRTVRSLSLSAALFSYLIKNSQDDAFMQELAIVLHSAILAGMIAKRKIRSLNCEPLVAATLFFSLGKMLFITFGGSNAKKYSEKLLTGPVSLEDEQDIIGFSLKSLTVDLGKKWFIGPTLTKSLEPNSEDDIIKIVHFSRKTVKALKEGWNSNAAEIVLQELQEFLGIPLQQVNTLVLESALRALQTFSLYSENLFTYLALPEKGVPVEANVAASQPTDSKLNPSRVTASIQEMSIILGNQTSPSMSDLLVVGLRSIRNSLDMDRAIFSLLSQDRLVLKGKSIDEKKSSGLLNEFKFELNAPEGWLFHFLLREGKSCWVGKEGQLAINQLRNEQLNHKLGKGPFFVTPFMLQGNIMGFYYVDRQVSSRDLDMESYISFVELCKTINGFLELVMMRAKQKK